MDYKVLAASYWVEIDLEGEEGETGANTVSPSPDAEALETVSGDPIDSDFVIVSEGLINEENKQVSFSSSNNQNIGESMSTDSESSKVSIDNDTFNSLLVSSYANNITLVVLVLFLFIAKVFNV